MFFKSKVMMAVFFALSFLAFTVTDARSASINTDAKYAFIIDYDTGEVLLDKRGDIPTAPASMSKLMTIYILMDKVKHGVFSPDDKFTVSANAWKKGGINTGSSTMFLKVGEKIKVKDLLKGIIIQSGNDACIVVAENIAGTEDVFAFEMNAKAKELGLNDSHFVNSTGWPHDEHLMSMRDIAFLSRHIIADFPEYYKVFGEKTFTHNKIKQENRNPLLFAMPGIADGLKTGHTTVSGFGLAASAKDPVSKRRVIVVLNGLRNMKARKDESLRLINWALREFESSTLLKKDEIALSIPVFMGGKDTVNAAVGQDIIVTNSKTGRKKIKVVANYNNPLRAPIAKGDKIGELQISSPDFQSKTFDLFAAENVRELGFFGTFWQRIKYVFGL